MLTTAVQEILHFHVFGGSSGNFKEFDNISVREVNAPTDYSADIKGSGTNKTLTANGNAGVGYEIPGYYGSAMTFDGTGDFLSIPNNSDFNYSDDGDFTIELWLYRKDTEGNDALIGVFENIISIRFKDLLFINFSFACFKRNKFSVKASLFVRDFIRSISFSIIMYPFM